MEEIPALNGLGQLTLLGNSALITLDEKKGILFFKKENPNHQLIDGNLSKFWEMVKDGEPGMLQSKGSQTVGHDLEAELLTLM